MIRNLSFFSFAVGIIFVFLALPAQAGVELDIAKNQSKRIGLNAAIGSVVVGNPEIADVSVVDARTVYITARNLGVSSINITDRMGRSVYEAKITVKLPFSGAVSLYNGNKHSLMLCEQICIKQKITSDAPE